VEVVEFNKEEPLTQVIGRLCREANADIVIPFDCADPHVNFEVKGYFVIPDQSAWKWVADRGA
jgi:hypothetical protein